MTPKNTVSLNKAVSFYDNAYHSTKPSLKPQDAQKLDYHFGAPSADEKIKFKANLHQATSHQKIDKQTLYEKGLNHIEKAGANWEIVLTITQSILNLGINTEQNTNNLMSALINAAAFANKHEIAYQLTQRKFKDKPIDWSFGLDLNSAANGMNNPFLTSLIKKYQKEDRGKELVTDQELAKFFSPDVKLMTTKKV